MKTFEAPAVEVIRFNVADILTASGTTEETTYVHECPTEMPLV